MAETQLEGSDHLAELSITFQVGSIQLALYWIIWHGMPQNTVGVQYYRRKDRQK